GARCLLPDLDRLDGGRLLAQRVPHAVAEVFRGISGVHGDGEITPDRRQGGHRPIWTEITHLGEDGRGVRAQQPDVRDALALPEQPVEAEPQRKPGPLWT